ncbi:MAG: hypothetical protein SCH39_02760 [Methanosarcinales archaeon]|nr:hypothetical protein [ANME-2 cluster archaeon]MDF1532549.1 hypothetical protein [ANME-2 cluster archaeon]MDW7775242.1 hypothetical protein [Methanosarcinales archaeon]
MFTYVENIVGFSREAFFEAYDQGVASGEESPEMDLTRKTFDRVAGLESEGTSIQMILIGAEKTIILYGGEKYEVIEMFRDNDRY